MGVLLAWVFGYVVGTRQEAEGFDDVVSALRELRDSEEVRSLVAIMRAHAVRALRASADLLAPAAARTAGGEPREGAAAGSDLPVSPIIAKARRLIDGG